MGSIFAFDLAEDISLSLEESVRIHLVSNHYPPVPEIMVTPCVVAIGAVNEGDYDFPVELPEGVTFRGATFAPAAEVVRGHHLEAWIRDED